MIGGFFRLLLWAVLAIFLVGATYAGWLLLLPVGERDVTTRMEHVCSIAGFAEPLFRPRGGSFSYAVCACMSGQLIAAYGAPVAAQRMDLIRKYALDAIWRKLTGATPFSLNGIPRQEAVELEEFGSRWSSINRVCRSKR